jgi:hypothetical protein
VAGGVDDPHAAVAEQVDGAAEGGERVHVGGLEVDRSVLEGMIELPADVAIELAATCGRLPFLVADDERGRRELGDPAGVVGMQMGHHHRPDRRRVDLPCAQLRRDRLVGSHLQVLEEQAAHRPHALLAVDGHGGVEARIHEDRPGAGVLHQERRHGEVDPLVARNADAESLQLAHAPLHAVQVGRRHGHPRAEQRPQPHGGAGLAAWQRQLGRAGLCCGAHPAGG